MLEKQFLPKHFGFYPDLLGCFFLSYCFVALIIEPRTCPVLCRGGGGSTVELVSSLLFKCLWRSEGD